MPTTPAEAAAEIQGYFAELRQDRQQFSAWLTGTINGGPGGDGRYPLTDFTGQTILVDCPAKVAGHNGAFFVDLFTNLPNIGVPAPVVEVQTLGHSFPSVGGASYRRTTTTGAKPYRIQSSDGQWWELDEEEPSFLQFGAKPNDVAFDSTTAVKGALEWNQARGGGLLRGVGNNRYYLSQSIVIDPTRTSIDGAGCIFDWRLKTFLDPATMPDLIQNGSFDQGQTNWTQGTNAAITNAINNGYIHFQNGYAEMDLPAVYDQDVLGPAYFEYGQKITAAKGDHIRITFTLDDLRTIETLKTVVDETTGEAVLKRSSQSAFFVYVGESVYADGQPRGLSVTKAFASKTVKSGRFTEVTPGPLTFTLELVIQRNLEVNPWLRLQSNAAFRLSNVKVQKVPDNACLIFTSTGSQFGHNRRHISNIGLSGKTGAEMPYVDGVRFDSIQPLSSRVMCYNWQMEFGSFWRGLIFQNATYLLSFYSCSIGARGFGIDSLEGATDSGENINFHGCVFGGTGVTAINNRGVSLHLVTCSIDFPSKFYVASAGHIELVSCWLEKNPSVAEDQFIIDIERGTFKMTGGRIQIDPWKPNMPPQIDPPAPFRVGEDALMLLRDVNCSNLGTTQDQVYVGEGEFYSRNLQGGSNMPSMMSRFSRDNLFPDGSFEGANIGVDCWVSSMATTGAAHDRLDRHNVAWNGTKLFTGTTTIGSNVITDLTGMIATGSNPGVPLSGPGITPGAVLLSRNLSTTANSNGPPMSATMTLPATANGVGEFGFKSVNPTGAAGVALSTATARTGLQSLRAFKSGTIGTGNPFTLYIPIPIEKLCRVAYEFWYRATAAPGVADNSLTSIFIQSHFAALAPGDDGVPVITQRLYSGHDATQVIHRASGRKFIRMDTVVDGNGNSTQVAVTSPDLWNRVAFSTNYIDEGTLHDGIAPAWATHMLVTINMISVPANFEVHFDDFVANIM